MVPLGDLLTKHEDWISLDPDTDYRQITARLWGKGLVLRGTLKGADIAASSQNRVRAGQFLISKIDARHGAFGLVPEDLDGSVVSADFPTFDVHTDHVLPGLLRWISKTSWFIALCRKASEGSTNRVRLKESRFLSQEIPLPPLHEAIHRYRGFRLDRNCDPIGDRVFDDVTGVFLAPHTQTQMAVVDERHSSIAMSCQIHDTLDVI